jgi:hypothetical protein
MRKVRVLALLTALALLLTMPAAAYAQAVPPHIFVGQAMVDGDDAMDGTIVTAMIDEEVKGSTTVMDGWYTLPVRHGNGTEISFMLGSMNVMEKGSWMQGGATLMNLMTGTDPMMGGIAGEPGEQGTTGARGPAGPAGPQGNEGPAGAGGTAGATGPPGPAGPAGQWGPAGPAGPAGEPSAPGQAGPEGQMGPAGPAASNTLSIIALAISIAALAGAGGAWYLIRSG